MDAKIKQRISIVVEMRILKLMSGIIEDDIRNKCGKKRKRMIDNKIIRYGKDDTKTTLSA